MFAYVCTYDSRVEENIYTNLTKAENTVSCLGQIYHYLTQIKYEKYGKTMIKRFKTWMQRLLRKDVLTKAHVRGQAAARRNAAPPVVARDQENN